MFDNIKSKIIQIIISVVLFIVAIVLDRFIELSTVLRVVLYLIPYIVISIDIYVEAFNGIKEGEIFDESFLMCIATIGAMCIGFFPNESPEFLEAILVMLLFQIGELFEIIAENNGEKSINALMIECKFINSGRFLLRRSIFTAKDDCNAVYLYK